uniref:Uncharacterized protein n=1 Tax=Branchiostoma floridae TaxID=7739 RepID=C3ZLY9_BRAFL|eukprot:XP_002590459.1 hypothetical protein BRAFLDRAFT_86325 [Branchiostoma floridae]
MRVLCAIFLGSTLLLAVSSAAKHCDWQPVFRILPGVGGEKARDVWTAGFSKDFGSDPLLFPAAHFKSPLVEEWETLGVQLVKVSLYSYRQGTEVRELIFDGKGSDKMNWFSKERLISSPWTDLKTETTNIFSIPGEVRNPKAPRSFRSFYINRNYRGCPKDEGWLVVGEGGTVCNWEKRDPRRPHILFSRKSTHVNWTTGQLLACAYSGKMSRQRQVIPASRGPPGSPTKDTLHVLESRLQSTEGDTHSLLSQLAEMGFDPRVIMSQRQAGSQALDPGVQGPISPFQHRAAQVAPEVLQKKYEELVARVCRTESTIQSLKLNLVTLQAEKDLRGKDTQGANEQMAAAVEAYDREVKKLKGRQERLQRDVEEAENRRETAVLDVQQLQNALEVSNTEKIKEELSRESSLRASLEESHATLLTRIHSMEGVVETERHEVDTLSSDCNVLRKETMQARDDLKKEQMIREQMEELVRTLRAETEIREREMKKFVGEHQVNQRIVADLKRQNVELRGEAENARRILQEQKEAYHQLEKENQEAHEALKTASGEIAKLMSDHQQALKVTLTVILLTAQK